MDNFSHNNDDRRFELVVEGHLCYIEYTEDKPKVLSLNHTWVPETLRGQVAAGRLAHAVMEWCRDNVVRIIPVCPYLVTFLKRHPEWRVLEA